MAAAVADSDRRRWAASGVELMSSATALDIFGGLLSARAPQAVVLPLRVEEFKAAARSTPLVSELAGPDPRRSTTRPDAPDLLQELGAIKPARRRFVLRAHLVELTSSVLGLDMREPFAARRGFRDLGMDSLMAVDLRNRLQLRIKRSLPSTLAFDQPNLDALTSYLADEVLGLAGEETSAADARVDASWEFADVLASVEDMSDEDVDRLLAERLGAGSLLT
jgi:polyketide synthase 12/polyene macrolide polyketide synthase/epothilone polyketide synthase D